MFIQLRGESPRAGGGSAATGFELCDGSRRSRNPSAHAGSPATSPAAVRVRGATFGALIAAFDMLELTLLASVIEGNKAAMHWRVKVRHNPTGEVHDTELFDLWTVEDGRAASFVQFADTALVARLMAQK